MDKHSHFCCWRALHGHYCRNEGLQFVCSVYLKQYCAQQAILYYQKQRFIHNNLPPNKFTNVAKTSALLSFKTQSIKGLHAQPDFVEAQSHCFLGFFAYFPAVDLLHLGKQSIVCPLRQLSHPALICKQGNMLFLNTLRLFIINFGVIQLLNKC